jgi:hypothetical protein
MSSKLENMINFSFTKSTWPKLQQSNPSFYTRFNRAWTNLQKNELEARLRLIAIGSEKIKVNR